MDQIGTSLIKYFLSELEMETTEGDWSNMFDDKAVEGGHKTICFEVAT